MQLGIFVLSVLIIISVTIWREAVIFAKNKRIDALEYQNDILQVTVDGLRKDRDDLHERYMASLEREARHDGKR